MSRKIKDIPISPLLENATDNNVATKDGTNLAEVGTDCISRRSAIDALRAMQTYKLFAGDDMLLIDQAGAQTELMLLPPAQPTFDARDTQYNLPIGTDCISRQAAIDALDEQIETCDKSLSSFDISMKDAYAVKVERASLVAFREILEYLPPAQPKMGRWIYCEDSTADCVDGYRCDQCGFFVPWDYKHKSIDYIKDYNFCPNCGADMRQREE